MSLNRPSLLTIINRMLADLKNRVDNSQTFLRRSVFKILAYVFGGALHLIYEFLEWIKNQIFVLTADEEYLERLGNEYGILRDAGTKGTGSALATGTIGISIPAGSEVQSDDGYKYRIDAAEVIGAGGNVTVDLTAVEVGDDYNQDANTILSFTSPIAGIDSGITVDSSAITSGEDEETVEEYRARVLFRKRFPPHGGTEPDYIVWAKEYSGVTRAWTIPEYQGIGTIGLAFVMDNEADIFPDEAERNAVKAYLISHTDAVLGKIVGIPVTAEPGFFVIEVFPMTVNMTIELSPNNGTVQAAILANLQDLILERGGSGQTITISQFYEAITTATGEVKTKINYPTEDMAAAINQVHVLGDITWSEYVG